MTSSPGPTRPNRLIESTSPYLLQHAHNPVDWFPWGAEAIEKAAREDKPIFLSIGYSACHWCHVMEHESFENDEIALILNRDFVSIKVDREERPDLDEIYMNATMLYNQGNGGWPMSVFLTPEQKPFFAGTYFPPESRWGRPGFKELLGEIARLWKEDRAAILRSADALTAAVRQLAGPSGQDGSITPETVTEVVNGLAGAFDRSAGGILSGQTNKFPPSLAIVLMLREYHHTVEAGKPESPLLDLVRLTLDRMARGGIYDHLGGGIARYSTDPQWLVPHFEKMLYDQALVSTAYVEAYQVTGEPRYADVARDIFDYVIGDLQSPEGGFRSSRDADSEGQEGRFYVWTKAEIMAVLGEEAGRLFCSYYDVTDSGNWEGHNILSVPRDIEVVARLNNISIEQLKPILAEARARLLRERSKRVPPALDDKVLTSWNGLMISALARGGRVTGEPKHVAAAVRAAEFVLANLVREGRLLRVWRGGIAHTGGYLDDYAFFVEGMLDLYEATFDWRWMKTAVNLTEEMIRRFLDEQGGGFFFTADDADPLIARAKDARDGAIPSGNSTALMNLVRLARMLGRDDLEEKADRCIAAFAGDVQPMGSERFLAAVQLRHASPREVVIVGPASHPGTRELIQAVDRVYDPHRVVLLADASGPDAAERQDRIPLLRGKTAVNGKPTAYVCRNYTCRRPVTRVDDFLQELRAE